MKLRTIAWLGLAMTTLCHSLAHAGETDDLRYAWTGTVGAGIYAGDITVDPFGDVIYVGYFSQTVDFDPSEGIDERTAVGVYEIDVFITKLHADGTYAWTGTMGGVENDSATSVVALPDQSILITGYFKDTADLDPTDGVDEFTAEGSLNGFVTKVYSDGSYAWTVTFGQGDGSASATGMGLDPDGGILLTGPFSGSVDFDPGPGEDIHDSPWSLDVFLTRLNADGSYGWTLTFGADDTDYAYSVGTDLEGNIFLTGIFNSTVDFDPGPGVDWHTAVHNSLGDQFVTKLAADGSYHWTHTLAVLYTGIPELAVTADGGVLLVGAFHETVDLDPTEGVDEHTANDDPEFGYGNDIFVTLLHGDGSYGWSRTMGGPQQDQGYDVAVDPYGNVIITGDFDLTVDFDPSEGVDQHTSLGQADCFVTKLGGDGSYVWTVATGSGYSDVSQYLAVYGDGHILATGGFRGPTDFDPTCAVDEHEAPVPYSYTLFVTKLLCSERDGDYDGDGVIDLADFAHLPPCLTGPGPTTCLTGCDVFDLDSDNDIDLTDFAAFQNALTAWP